MNCIKLSHFSTVRGGGGEILESLMKGMYAYLGEGKGWGVGFKWVN